MNQINEEFPNTFCSTSPPTQLIIATWIDYLKADSNPGSNFQLIVVSGRCKTFGIALYVNVSITSADTGLSSHIKGEYVPPDPTFFPFGTTVMDAPTMMLNSTMPGTYIFSLNHMPPNPCTLCKAKLLKMACEAMRRINGKKLPAPCHD
ncbi:PREDICTED: uncharacterized protein LOC109587042 [Amphimedon queenslandica]|uniref:Uncharacterized protein n=1 Tax=Amphimedon queenslandica TaxID=400682 RepID=A0AAN0JPU5_AMPQE|nr:PREDICTED: uncharacterized protein LOC109587042 [Amphimedon queenslandica]XP_019858823.1 PREDICTED: uncharacterized protein LOC109587042 [Amphimedon queenslandica]|eukprot:XP_019858822.1 PREDICTED: uncharacterized protein LOC109587042 [Amphimedon queenslandica]